MKVFVNPELQVEMLAMVDVISTSEFMPGENEGGGY